MEWISVKDRLPEDGFYFVWTASDGGPQHHAFWYKDGRWCFDSDMSPGEPLFMAGFFVDVTHWMINPEPPND